MTHEIACAIANSRAAPATKVRQDQLSALTLVYRLASKRVKYLSDEFAFIHMQPMLLRARVAESAHLCHTCMVIGKRIPGALNAFSRGGNRRARLTGMDGYTHTRKSRVQAMLLGYLR